MYAVLEPSVERVLLIDTRRPQSYAAVADAAATVSPAAARKLTFLEADLRSVAAVATELADIGGGDERDVADGRLRAGGSGAAEPEGTCAAGVGGDSDSGAAAAAFAAAGLLRASREGGGLGIVAVHACGSLTDSALALGAMLRVPVAVMPCCYGGTNAACGSGTGGKKGRWRAPLGVRRALGVALSADVARSFEMSARGFDVDWSAVPRCVTPMNRVLIAEPVKRAAGP
eukprot:352297-Chlamydomonas_euryale.AAC.2